MPRKKKIDLLAIARELAPADLARLADLAKSAPQLARLQAKRDKLAAQIEKLDADLARLAGDAAPARRGRPAAGAAKKGPKSGGKRGKAAGRAAKRRPGRPAAAKTGNAATKPASAKRATRGRRGAPGALMKSVAKIMADASAPMNRKEIVAALPDAGFKVKDEKATLKAVSQLLITRPKDFQRAARGSYSLRPSTEA